MHQNLFVICHLVCNVLTTFMKQSLLETECSLKLDMVTRTKKCKQFYEIHCLKHQQNALHFHFYYVLIDPYYYYYYYYYYLLIHNRSESEVHFVCVLNSEL
jgi:hypothetical protein